MPKGNTVETLLNQKLAEILRNKGFIAEAEQRLEDSRFRIQQLDVIVDLDEFAMVIEAEFAPSDGKADADRRLNGPDPLMWRGLPIKCGMAISYPEELKSVPESEAREILGKISTLQASYRQYISTDSIQRATKSQWSATNIGSVNDLATFLQDYWIKTENSDEVDELVRHANAAISDVSDMLCRLPAHYTEELDGGNANASKALIWLNALLFQELLAQNWDSSSESRSSVLPDVSPLNPQQTSVDILEEWQKILDINWYPIFQCAYDAFVEIPRLTATQIVRRLQTTVARIAASGLIKRHDLAGRIFHRLLDGRKFLATNYTSIPAAIILAGLAFDDQHKMWQEVNFKSLESISGLRIVDPACGSGTLLMAATQEILEKCRTAEISPDCLKLYNKVILEEVLLGYDVVPAAIHLAASTLSMSETSQLIQNMQLYRTAHDVKDGKARLGSLDRLSTSQSRGHATVMGVLDSDEEVVTGTGPEKDLAQIPFETDLFIVNPPYTRAGGPGPSTFKGWNPLFGSVLDSKDKDLMEDALKTALEGTPASLFAGLGSAFLVLADENISMGGRIAFVLPLVATTGSRWQKIRALLLRKYSIDWVVVSHDPETRSSKADIPRRIFTSFSESTNISEVLLIATKRPSTQKATNLVHFVNLRHNPRNPIEAKLLTRLLLSSRPDFPTTREVVVGNESWGEVFSVEQTNMDSGPWYQTTFAQSKLFQASLELLHNNELDGSYIPMTKLSDLFDLGPYHMQIKGRDQGLFTITETNDSSRLGYPALWHHDSKNIRTLSTNPNAKLQQRSDKGREEQIAMLDRSGFLQLANEFRLNTQSVGAAITKERALGVASWITLLPKQPREGCLETACLWLNSSLGMFARIFHANRPYPARVRLTHESSKELPILDLRELSKAQLLEGKKIFNSLSGRELMAFSSMDRDPIRREINHRFFAQVMKLDPLLCESLDRQLAQEPFVIGKKVG